MDRRFQEAVDSLHPKFERLVGGPPFSSGDTLPLQGVYLFSENGRPLYVGRSNYIRRRFGHHTRQSSPTNQAALATLIARQQTGIAVDYLPGARARLLANADFMDAFTEAKKRVRKMEFRAVEEADQTRQALLEIYCAVALGTPFNDFATH